MTRKMYITEKMHKKMPIKHTRKQRRSGGGFLDWMMGTRQQPQLPVFAPQPQSFNPQHNPQQSSSLYSQTQSSRQGYGYGPMNQRLGQGFNQFGQSLGQSFGQGYDQFRQGVNQFGQTVGQGFGQGYDQFRQGVNQFGQSLGQGVNQFGQTVGQYNPIRYASNVYRNYQSNPTLQSNPALPYQGGKIKRRIMKGGYQDNISVTGLASTAAPFSGPTAQPHQMVGGKTRKGGKKVGKKGGKTYRNKK
jgi:hypothetical protein